MVSLRLLLVMLNRIRNEIIAKESTDRTQKHHGECKRDIEKGEGMMHLKS
jgi:hypothetical protein